MYGRVKVKLQVINADTRWKRVVRVTLHFYISKGRTQNRNLDSKQKFISGKEKSLLLAGVEHRSKLWLFIVNTFTAYMIPVVSASHSKIVLKLEVENNRQ